MNTQNEQIIKHLEAGNSITPLDALKKFSCFRLASRISEIKRMGYVVQSEWIVKKNKKIQIKQQSFGGITEYVSSTKGSKKLP